MQVKEYLLLPYYERVMRELPIDLQLGTTLTPKIVQLIQPDLLILAVGSRPEAPRWREPHWEIGDIDPALEMGL